MFQPHNKSFSFDHTKNSTLPQNPCGVCLLDVDFQQKQQSAVKSVNFTPQKKLCYAGRWYHTTCANFWLNKISDLLPDLPLPGIGLLD